LRLDNVVYRAGWAATRPQARQFVSHGLVKIDGKRVNIPSYTLTKGEVVSLSDKARNMIIIQHNVDTLGRTPVGVARCAGWWQGSFRTRVADA
jgi:SSU ribosomal protein S4P